MTMRVLGLMSGTSADGVDAAVGEFVLEDGTLTLACVGHTTLPWPVELAGRIREVIASGSSSVAEVCRLDRDLGVALGEIAETALDVLDRGQVDLVASHGQTIYHDVAAGGTVNGTLQIGQPAEIAERVGVPVVADFRVRDVAAGGQGAPLVSMFDHLLLAGQNDHVKAVFPALTRTAGMASGVHAARRPSGHAGLLNLGGIANLTAVRPGEPTIAFDCGPGNALLDLAIRDATGDPFDAGGVRTAHGRVDDALLMVLLGDPYLAAKPPKSTGKERYGAAFLADALHRAPVTDVDDVVATLAEAVAVAVARDVARLGLGRVWASGGGVHNAGLMHALGRRLEEVGTSLGTSDELGVPSDHKEAYAFTLLGWLTWHGLSGSIPSCTGASGARVLGTIVPGAEPLQLPVPIPVPPTRLALATK